jgi:hypothetical protein
MKQALVYRAEPGYLTAMGILKQGRFFTAQDETGTQPVIVIDEVLASQYFPNENPLGKRISLGTTERRRRSSASSGTLGSRGLIRR